MLVIHHECLLTPGLPPTPMCPFVILTPPVVCIFLAILASALMDGSPGYLFLFVLFQSVSASNLPVAASRDSWDEG